MVFTSLNYLHQGCLETVDVPKAVEYVLLCMNFDGGFGCRPGSESHSGQVLTLDGFTVTYTYM